MAQIKTRFGTLNLGSESGGGVPLALQENKNKDENIVKPIDPTSWTIISDLALNTVKGTNDQGEEVIKSQTLIKKAISLIDIVKPLTDNTTAPLVNSIRLNEEGGVNKLMLNTVDLSALPQLQQQDSWLILDSEKALIEDKPQAFINTDKTGMSNLETK